MWWVILGIYLLSIVAWASFLISNKAKLARFITIPFAPIFLVLGLIALLRIKKNADRPIPLPKKLQGAIKKDRVLYNGKVMSIAEVNRITGKNYTLEDVYGKEYVDRLIDDDTEQFDKGESDLEIDEKVRKDEAFELVLRFAKARQSGNFESIKSLFVKDVVLVHYENDTLHGANAVISFWRHRYESSISRQVKFDFRIEMCMFYNGPALLEMPERFEPMLVMFRIIDGKIAQMVLAPKNISHDYPYYGGLREAPFTLNYFKPFLKQRIERRGNRIPCPNCGELSENLEWYIFQTQDRFSYKLYGGTVSICPHCERTVELFPIDSSNNAFVSRNPREEFESLIKPRRPSKPKLSVLGLEYARPLIGTPYLSCLDDSKMIELDIAKLMNKKGLEYDPCTARTCAAEFTCLMLSQLSRTDRKLFDAICDCYRIAYKNGVIEAGNNLAILLYNYAGEESDGKILFKECADKGCANAASNYFSLLWASDKAYDKAIEFALANNTPSIRLSWNLAVLYLAGAETEGNTLSVDKEKARFYLNQIISGSIHGSEDDGRLIEDARLLLRRINDFDPFADTARVYITEGIPLFISAATSEGNQNTNLHRVLPHIRIPANRILNLQLASDENGHGDISRFQLFDIHDIDDEPICQENDIIYELEVDRSVYGAWEVFLFSKARNLLPTYWHGGYNEEKLLFDVQDFKLIMSQRGHCQDVIFKGDNLKPKVTFSDDTATVECCLWSEWGGLCRETFMMEYRGNSIIRFEHERTERLYYYDCGIMF